MSKSFSNWRPLQKTCEKTQYVGIFCSYCCPHFTHGSLAILFLVRSAQHFCNTAVGAVCGRLPLHRCGVPGLPYRRCSAVM